MAGKQIGILAMQGAFREHEESIKKVGANPIQIRKPEELNHIDALIIPGGESTTIGKLLNEYGLTAGIVKKANNMLPIWGICAGMILLAKEIIGSDQIRLGLMDMQIKRNAYGRQADSFETELSIDEIGVTKGVFIRAPYAEKVWGNAKVMCRHRDKIVMVKQDKNLLATAFHPELTQSRELHKYFMEMI